jgi:predicted PurR-regulated permease PerM
MVTGRAISVPVGIIAAILIAFAAYQASSVFAPLALALFIIALVWPLQQWLQSIMPKLLALAITVTVTVTVGLFFGATVVWAVGRVWRALIADSARYQATYDGVVGWLEARGISVAGLWAEHFNVAWMLRLAQQLGGHLNTTLIFWILTLTYVILGLLEVDDMHRKIAALKNREAARILLNGSRTTAMQFRRYMWVRTLMSVLTGLLVWAFARIVGLPLAVEWGMIAFVLNYIPFIGPFVATLLPTMLAMLQFDTWQAVIIVFVCLNIIQFVVGSYIEPQVAGNVLSMSPTLVLFAILFWTFMWGFLGTFIGVPIVIAILTFCREHPRSQWVSDLLGKGITPSPSTSNPDNV